jgi:hypothetical protein
MFIEGSSLSKVNQKGAYVQCTNTYCHPIEKIVVVILVLFENSDIFEYLWIDLDSVIVSNGILSKEVEDDKIWSLQCDVFTPQRATAHGVRFIFTFLVTSTKSKFIDEVHSGGTLTVGHHF